MTNKIKLTANKEYTVEELEQLIAEAKKPKAQRLYPGLNEMYKYFYSNNDISSDSFTDHKQDYVRIATGLILTPNSQTYEELVIKGKLLYKIDQINAEVGWVEDFDGLQENYYLNYDISDYTFGSDYDISFKTAGVKYMSKEAAEWLLSDKVSKEERKIFCGIK